MAILKGKKYDKSKVKNFVDGFKSKLDTVEGRIRKQVDRSPK